MPFFSPPDFTFAVLALAPDATLAPAAADGVLPDGFFSTTNLPTYVRVGGSLAPAPRAAHGCRPRARR